jgi:type IV secretory pathway TrbF-like protein
MNAEDQASVDFLEGRVEQLSHWLRWTTTGLGASVTIGVILAVAVLVLILRSGVTPYLVMIDPGGKRIWAGVQGAHTLTDRQVAGWLAEWTQWMRQRFNADETPLLRQHLQKAWDMTTASGDTSQQCKAQEQFNAELKVVAAEQQANGTNRQRVLVQPTTFERESPTRFRLNFTETRSPLYGQPAVVDMAATFEVYLRPEPGPFGPKLTVEELEKVPVGIFVCNFAFRQAIQEVTSR